MGGYAAWAAGWETEAEAHRAVARGTLRYHVYRAYLTDATEAEVLDRVVEAGLADLRANVRFNEQTGRWMHVGRA